MERTKDQRILRHCCCGWSKVTTYHGLRIHQGKAKCVGNSRPQACTASAGQTRRHHSQVEHHRASEPNIAVGTEEEHQSSEQTPQQQNTPQQENSTMNLEQQSPPQQESNTARTEPQQESNTARTEPQQESNIARTEPVRVPPERYTQKPQVKWPKSSDREVWRNFNERTCTTLQNSLKGNSTSKLNNLGHFIHEEGRNRLGDKPVKRPSPKQSGRQEREIFQLVKERCLLRKSWKKAEAEEKEGLKDLWNKIKERLVHLRRAERIKKRRSRRKKARTCFFRDPFKFTRSLLEENKTGTLQVTKQELEQHIVDHLSDNL
ncbi:uncharacterized protein LOC118335412 [Xyrichtys novacula]|uniref:Uncharacterized protein LOC118335412 n=1 Tax=Xyrichtys novacula TaxID=13765 RepID=A0AAV1G871_XYRNO|nr:uncharacterized protein LOC118335412 [Xyrichtys novacula]